MYWRHTLGRARRAMQTVQMVYAVKLLCLEQAALALCRSMGKPAQKQAIVGVCVT